MTYRINLNDFSFIVATVFKQYKEKRSWLRDCTGKQSDVHHRHSSDVRLQTVYSTTVENSVIGFLNPG
eukprot:4573305-Karenia_brevis.AAC.1